MLIDASQPPGQLVPVAGTEAAGPVLAGASAPHPDHAQPRPAAGPRLIHQAGTDGPSAAEQLAGQIADAIMLGEYPLGTWLRQEQLGQRFGVSRQPVREALRRLEAIGMIEARPRRGLRVKGLEPGYIREGYLIRAELEGLAARLAAGQAGQAGLAALQRAWAAFRDSITQAFDDGSPAGARAAWVHHHNQFHEQIHQASGAGRLVQLIATMNLTLPRNLSIGALRDRATLAENLRQHEIILSAIELGSGQVAEAAMKDHVLRSGERIADWFARQQEALAAASAAP